MKSYLLKMTMLMSLASSCMSAQQANQRLSGANVQNQNRQNASISSAKSDILMAIMHKQDDTLKSLIGQSSSTDHKFVVTMGKRAVQFHNTQAISILMDAYTRLAQTDSQHKSDYIEAKKWLHAGMAWESGYMDKKDILEWLIKNYPQQKVYWLKMALLGASYGCQEKLADWILSFSGEIIQHNPKSAQNYFKSAMADAVAGYSPRIAIKIGNLSTSEFPINPNRAITKALKLNDQEALAFFKKKFSKRYNFLYNRQQRTMATDDDNNEDNWEDIEVSGPF